MAHEFGTTRIKLESELEREEKGNKRCEVDITLTDIWINEVVVLD